MPRLRRSDCHAPGIGRRRAGKGFIYTWPDGQRVADPEVLGRIKGLAVPPAWSDVWISPWPNGHIQALGTDARGRRQYRYHDAWRTRRDQEKFDHMLEFAGTLPELRRRCLESLDGDDELSRERVLACAVRLLDLGFFRIGTEGYAEENQTYGLATMEERHVKVNGDVVSFDYVAKAGKRRLQTVVDPRVADVVAQLKRRRVGGHRLLVAREGRRWSPVGSHEINDYIKDVTGGSFSAKDFRTWTATVLAAVALAVSTRVRSPSGRKKAVTRAVREVAHYLGNTPAVARASYIDPRVIDRYLSGQTINAALGHIGEGEAGGLSTQGAAEEAVLDLLSDGEALAA